MPRGRIFGQRLWPIWRHLAQRRHAAFAKLLEASEISRLRCLDWYVHWVSIEAAGLSSMESVPAVESYDLLIDLHIGVCILMPGH